MHSCAISALATSRNRERCTRTRDELFLMLYVQLNVRGYTWDYAYQVKSRIQHTEYRYVSHYFTNYRRFRFGRRYQLDTTCTTLHIKLQRRGGYYIDAVNVPTLIISVLTVIGLLIAVFLFTKTATNNA